MADNKKRKVLLPSTEKEPEKVTFVVRAGQTFGMKKLGAGKEIELTVAEALPFSDKLEPADRSTVLPGGATPEELADAGVEQVSAPSGLRTDRDVMTPEQRASTSQVTSGGAQEPSHTGTTASAKTAAASKSSATSTPSKKE